MSERREEQGSLQFLQLRTLMDESATTHAALGYKEALGR